jgi:RNA polymerase primary sigma factor
VELCASIFEHHKKLKETGYVEGAAKGELVQEKVDQALAILTSLEEDIIRLRHGLTDGYTYTVAQVAEQMGMAPARVAEIEASAMEKLLLS